LRNGVNSLYGRLMVDVEGFSLTSEDRELLANPQVGGVILFARNIQSRSQVCMLVAEIRCCSDSLLIAVDQEGGRVQRFRVGFTKIPAMQIVGDLVESNFDEGICLSRELGWLMASEVLACGVDISFAPVLDVDRDTSSIIGNRAFSNQPNAVITAAKAFIAGMHDAGMASTGKHFPGHGGIVADSHLEAPIDQRNWQQLEEHDLKPFKLLAKTLDGIMPAHITFPAIDAQSVGFSSFWLKQVLRQQLGFTGVIFSDDLSMKGADVAGGYVEKAKDALAAGCDMVLVCNSRQGATQVLAYMEEQKMSQSTLIGAMRSAKQVNWLELEQSTRRKSVLEKLASMA
jgi:beta-N-acetylhexosaminidase